MLCKTGGNKCDSNILRYPVQVNILNLHETDRPISLQNYEIEIQAHQEALTRMPQEIEDLRKARCSETEPREEAHLDAVSEDGGNKLDKEL